MTQAASPKARRRPPGAGAEAAEVSGVAVEVGEGGNSRQGPRLTLGSGLGNLTRQLQLELDGGLSLLEQDRQGYNVNGHLELFFHFEIELFVFIHDSGTGEERVEKMVNDSDDDSDCVEISLS